MKDQKGIKKTHPATQQVSGRVGGALPLSAGQTCPGSPVPLLGQLNFCKKWGYWVKLTAHRLNQQECSEQKTLGFVKNEIFREGASQFSVLSHQLFIKISPLTAQKLGWNDSPQFLLALHLYSC